MSDTSTPPDLGLRPLRNRGLSPEVARSLREAIFSGKLKPGDPILEAAVAEQLHVSRSPLREALLALEEEGLVEIRPRRGSFVRRLGERQIAEIATIRIPLESTALELARGNADAKLISQLEEQLGLMNDLAREGRVREFVSAEFKFHQLIWQASGHELLHETLVRISTPWFAFFEITFTCGSLDFRASAETHRVLIQFLRAETELSATQCYLNHLSGLSQPIREILNHFPGLTRITGQQPPDR